MQYAIKMRLISEEELALLGISVWKTWRPSKYTGGLWWKLEDVLYINEVFNEPTGKHHICKDKWHKTQYIPFGRVKLTCSRRYLQFERSSDAQSTLKASYKKVSGANEALQPRNRLGRQSQESVLVSARAEPQWEVRDEPVTCTLVAFCQARNRFAAIDLLDNLYCFDIDDNTFWWILHCPDATSLSFCSNSDGILIVGKESGRIDLICIELKITIGNFNEHTYPVKQLSSQDITCLSASLSEVWIWNVHTFEALYSLTLQNNSAEVVAKFVPQPMTTILTMLPDSSLYVWSTEKVDSCCPKLKAAYFGRDFMLGDNITCIEFSKYDDIMSLAGDHKNIALINIKNQNDWKFETMLTLPSNIYSTRAMKFLKITNTLDEEVEEERNCLAVLCSPHSEIIIFDLDNYNSVTCFPPLIDVIDIEGDPIFFDLSFDGQYACFMTKRDFISIYTTFWWLNREFCPWLHFQRKSCFILEEPDVVNSEIMSRSNIDYHEPSSPGELTGRGLYRNVLAQKGKLEKGERFSFWCISFCLPDNIDAFQVIYCMGIHPGCAGLIKKSIDLPIKNCISFKRLLSVFYYWSPLFFLINSFPEIVLHFCTLLNWRIKLTFEVLATLFENYCSEWYINYPETPRKINKTIDSLIHKKDEELHNHLKLCGLKASDIAWGLLNTFFIDALGMSEWLFLWDHIIFSDAHYLIMASVSIILNCRCMLLNFKSPNDFRNTSKKMKDYFVEYGNIVSVVLMAYDLHFCGLKSGLQTNPFEPLTKGSCYKPLRIIYNSDKVLESVNNILEERMYEIIELQELLDFFRLLDPRPKLPIKKSDFDAIKTEAPDSPALERAIDEYKLWQAKRILSVRNKKVMKVKSLEESNDKKPGNRRSLGKFSLIKTSKTSDPNSSSDERKSSPIDIQAIEELHFQNLVLEKKDKLKRLQKLLNKYELFWLKGHSMRQIESERLKHFRSNVINTKIAKEDISNKGSWSYYTRILKELKGGIKNLNTSVKKVEVMVDCHKILKVIENNMRKLKRVEEAEEFGFESGEATDVIELVKSSSEVTSEHKDLCEIIKAGLNELRDLIGGVSDMVDELKNKNILEKKAAIYQEFGGKASYSKKLKVREAEDGDRSTESDDSEEDSYPWKKEREAAFVKCLKTVDVTELRRLWNQPVVKFNLMGE